MQFPILGEYYKLPASQFVNKDLVNFIPLVNQDKHQGKSISMVQPTPGLELFADTGSGNECCRLLFQLNDDVYTVIGNTFYYVTPNGALSSKGTLNPTFSTRCTALVNPPQTQIMICDGTYGYVYKFSDNTFTQIADLDFTQAQVVVGQDGYAIYYQPNSKNWFISAPNDFTSWDALDESTTNSVPDNITGMQLAHLELFISMKTRTEVWSNTGASPFPWERNNNVLVHFGVAATHSMVTMDNTIWFLGADETGTLSVVRLNSYTAEIVSSESVNTLLDTAEDVSDAYAFGYGMNGHLFYCLTVPNLNKTICIDASTGLAHIRTSQTGATPATQGYWRANSHVYVNNRHIVGDAYSGKLYLLKSDVYTENGTYIKREIVTPVLADPDQKRLYDTSVLIDCQVGVGLATGQGSDPQLMVEISFDGGKSFSAQIFRSLGAIGRGDWPVEIKRIGQARNYVLRLSITDPVFVSIFGFSVQTTVGDS